jgi:hypothetical protein
MRLDSVVRRAHGATLIFEASGLQGLSRERQDAPGMFWQQASPADSLEVSAAGVRIPLRTLRSIGLCGRRHTGLQLICISLGGRTRIVFH